MCQYSIHLLKGVSFKLQPLLITNQVGYEKTAVTHKSVVKCEKIIFLTETLHSLESVSIHRGQFVTIRQI